MELSVVIPTHNSSKVISRTLDAVFNNKDVELEDIIVDDASTDNTLEIIRRYPCRIFALKKRSGPAKARNIGAKVARADIILFLDADAVLEKGSLRKFLIDFSKYPDIACVSGVFQKDDNIRNWFYKYRDLQTHYWHQSSSSDASVFVLTAGAIKKRIFFEVGGFKEEFGQFADVEDFEIGHRISQKYKMFVDKEIRFNHLEESSCFLRLTKKLFRRSRLWMRLFLKRKRFEKNYATTNRAIAIIFAFLSLILFLLTIKLPWLIGGGIICLCGFFLSDIGFYKFLSQQGSIGFFMYASAVHYFFSIVLFLGAVFGLMEIIFNKKKVSI